MKSDREIIFICYKSGSGGNFLSYIVNKMLSYDVHIQVSPNGNAHRLYGVALSSLIGKKSINFFPETDHILAIGIEYGDIDDILTQYPNSKILVISYEEEDYPQIMFNLYCKLYIDDYHRFSGKNAWISLNAGKEIFDMSKKPWEQSFDAIKSFVQKEGNNAGFGLDERGVIASRSFKYSGDDKRVINIPFKKIFNGDTSIIQTIRNFLQISKIVNVKEDLRRYKNAQPIFNEHTFNKIKELKRNKK